VNRVPSPALRWLLALLVLCLPAAAWAHPTPVSFVDITLGENDSEGTLTVHVSDLAHELGIADPADMPDVRGLQQMLPRIGTTLAPRFNFAADRPLEPEWLAIMPYVDDKDAVQIKFRLPGEPPASFSLAPHLFPADPQHQTFVNIYEDGELAQQLIFGAESAPRTFYSGTTQGVLAVIKTFVPSGIHHIWIGPDHLLFLLGLLLMGGSFWQLVKIITAFTIGHSITLALAVLDIVTVPGWLVEPAIALTIVVVGADNLLRGQGRDLRFWMALVFGLIHGFGFASVLQEFRLPQSALGWSLFSFNVGVELGQLAAVIPVALVLAGIRRWSPILGRRVAMGGSVIVIGAGAWWFVQRVFLAGE
jgi:hydrogenase/urease accessory protein HupE